jgi:hypothetical protein
MGAWGPSRWSGVSTFSWPVGVLLWREKMSRPEIRFKIE